ncbi:ABC transporter permease [Gordonia sp. NPDC003504]
MIDVLRAEQIKIGSIRSPYWCMGLVVLLSIGITALFSALFTGAPDETGSSGTEVADGAAMTVLLVGLQQFAVIVLMIMAVLGITSEYRFSTIRASFLAVPNRPRVLIAKAVVYVALTVITTLVLAVVCILILQAGLGTSVVGFGNSSVIRQIWGTPIFAALCVLLSMGVGALVRQTAGAISIVLVWMLVLETILGSVPRVRDWVGPFLPFANGTRFLSGGSADDVFHWNSYVSLVYFAVVAIVVFVAGVVVTNRRDA